MARRKKAVYADSNDTLTNEILAAILFTIGLFSFLSLIFYSQKSGYDIQNTMGSIGVFISGILANSFGVTSFFIPAVMFYCSYIVFTNNLGLKLYRKTISGFLFLFSLTTLLGLTFKTGLMGYDPSAGWIGVVLSSFARDFFAGSVGSYIIVTIVLLLSLILITEVKINQVFRFFKYSAIYGAEIIVSIAKSVYGFIMASAMNLYDHYRYRKNRVAAKPEKATVKEPALIEEKLTVPDMEMDTDR